MSVEAQGKVVSLHAPPRSSGRSGVFAEVRAVCADGLGATLQSALHQVDDRLFERLDQATSAQDQEALFLAMREIRAQGERMQQRLREDIERQFRAAERGEDPLDHPADPPPSASLVLEDDAQSDRRVALQSICSRAERAHGERLRRLRARLRCALAEQHSPTIPGLDPQCYTQALERALHMLEVDRTPELILLKLVERQYLGALPGLISTADAALLEAFPTAAAMGSRTTRERPAPAHALAGARRRRLAPVTGDEVLASAESLLARRRFGCAANDPRCGDGSEAAMQARAAAVDGLARVQRMDIGAAGENEAGVPVVLSGADLRALLGAMVGGERAGLGRTDDSILDMVSLVFSRLLDDEALCHTAQALLGRLQIPMLRAALIDRSVFGRSGHPVRAYVNDIARVASAWVDGQDLEAEASFRYIRGSIEWVIEHFDADVEVFAQAGRDLRAFVDQRAQRAQRVEQRTRSGAEGEDRLDSARAQAAQCIIESASAAELPEAAWRLIDRHWRRVLVIALTRYGNDSEQWNGAREVVRQLVQSVQPVSGEQERRERVTQIARLVREVRQGLEAIGCVGGEQDALLKALAQCHVRLLARTPGDTPRASPAGASAVGDPGEGPSGPWQRGPQDPSTGLALRESVHAERERLAGVAIGTWCHLTQPDDGRAVRGRLSARLAGGERYIFVNESGFKVADRRLDALAGDLREGRMKVLDDDELFERALESVIVSLRDADDADALKD